jgi:hypothetical protein
MSTERMQDRLAELFPRGVNEQEADEESKEPPGSEASGRRRFSSCSLVSSDSIISAGMLAAFRGIDLGARAEERLDEKSATLWTGVLDGFDVAQVHAADPAKREVKYRDLAHLYKHQVEEHLAGAPELWLDLPIADAPAIRAYLARHIQVDKLEDDAVLLTICSDMISTWRPPRKAPQPLSANSQAVPTELLEHFLSTLPSEELQAIAESFEVERRAPVLNRRE